LDLKVLQAHKATQAAQELKAQQAAVRKVMQVAMALKAQQAVEAHRVFKVNKAFKEL
tara:strand:- start:464 stop:634 length:171 start_codon:yes stop_codon:yes gene_type:complete